MAVTEAEVDAMLAEPEPGPAPAAPVTEDEVDAMLEQDELDRDAEISNVFRESFSGNADRKAQILGLRRNTGLEYSVIESNFDDIARNAQASKIDARKWRQENAELAEMVHENRRLGEIVMRDEPASGLVRNLRELGKATNLGFFEMEQALPWSNPLDILNAPEKPDFNRPPAKVPLVTDPSANQGLGAKLGATFRQSQAQADMSARGFKAIFSDDWENEKAIVDLERDVAPKYVGASAGEQYLVDAVEMAGSVLETYKGAGVGGVIGAGVGALPGLVFRNPAMAKSGSMFGGSVGARIGGGVKSLEQEGGSFYLEVRKEKTDAGQTVDPLVAKGSALAYGATASIIDVALFGAELSMFGPLGDAVRAGTGKAFFKAMLKDQGARALFADIGRRWATGTGAEMTTEGLQEIASIVSSYAARSMTSGESESIDVPGAINRVATSMGKAATGAGAMAPVTAGTNIATQIVGSRLQREMSERSAKKVAAIVQAAQTSPTVKADPAAVAGLIEKTSSDTHMFIDPAAVSRFFQENGSDGDAAAKDLMGEKGPERLREALATGEKLEIPMAEFLEKWATKDIGKALVDHAATKPGLDTAAETQAKQASGLLEKHTQQILKEYEAGNIVRESVVEKGLDALEAQLVQAGTHTKKEARDSVTLQRAYMRVAAEKVGKTIDELFGDDAIVAGKKEQADALGKAALAPTAAQPSDAASEFMARSEVKPEPQSRQDRIAAEQMLANPNAPRLSSVQPESDAKARQEAALAAFLGEDEKAAETEVFEGPETKEDAALRADFEALSPEDQQRSLVKDANTGLNNIIGLRALPRPPERPFMAEWEIEGGKFFNDFHGHETLDGAFRSMAKVLVGQGIADGAKVAGSIRAWVTDEKQAQQIADAMTTAVGGGVRVTTSTALAEPGMTLDEVFAQAGEGHKAHKAKEFEGGKLGHRKGAPKAFMRDAPAIAFEQGMEGLDPKSPEVKEILAKAAKAAAPVAKKLKKSKGVKTPISEEQAKAFGETKDVFSAIHTDPSGLHTEAGFNRARALRPAPFVAMADLRALGLLNKFFTKKGADVIMRYFKEVLAEVGGSAFDASHLHGDEFAGQGADRDELDTFFSAAANEARKLVFFRQLPDGRVVLQVGVHFAHGIGKTVDEADRIALPAAKERQGDVGEPRTLTAEEFDAEVARLGASGDYHWVAVEAGDEEGHRQVPGGASGEQEGRVGPQLSEATLSKLRNTISKMKKGNREQAIAWLEYFQGLRYVRPKVSDAIKKRLRDFGVGDPLGDDRDEFGRDMTRGLGGRKSYGKEPEELRRKRLEKNMTREEWEAAGYKTFYQAAYHGSPHPSFEKFSLQKIGTGEGAQVRGWGLYFASKKEVGEYYRQQLAGVFPTIDKKSKDALSSTERLALHRILNAKANLGRGALSFEEALPAAIVALEKEIAYRADSLRQASEGSSLHKSITKSIGETKAALELMKGWTPDRLTEMGGQLYKVEIPDATELLDSEKPINEQSDAIQGAIARIPAELRDSIQEYLDDNGVNADLSELTGRELYQALQKYAGEAPLLGDGVDRQPPEETSRFLLSLGIPGLQYLDQGSRGKGEGSYNYVIWDDSRIQVQETFYQGEDEPRGYVEIAREGAKRLFKVVLNKNADMTTFLHESGHIFLELMADLAEAEDAPERLKQDFAAALKWMGVEKRSDIKREHHEKWARTFEAYLYEGKAPSTALVRAFTSFRLWLREAYASLGSLKAELNEDIRGVFDRMLATDDEIARSKGAMGLIPTFRSPEEAGMTPEQWQAYVDAQERATSHATQATLQRMLKDQLRETESWWKTKEKALVKEAQVEHDELPASKAKKHIGEHKLDRAAVEAMIGKDVAKTSLGGKLKKEGQNPDDIAELFGFATGKEMLEAVLALPEREAWAKEQASERMRQQHPGVLDEREVLRELAAKGLHGEHSADWLLREWAALRKKSGQQGSPPVEAIMDAAKHIVESRQVRTLNASAALRAERSAAEKAAIAATKGNFAQAYVYKQQQLLNHFIYRSLLEAREQRDSFEALTTKLRDDKAQRRLGKASPAYLDVVNSILEALDLREPERREKPPASVQEAVAIMEDNGETIAFDADLINRLLVEPRDWRTMTVSEMRGVSEALRNIKQAATNRNTALIEGRRVEKEQVVQALLAEAVKNVKVMDAVASTVSAAQALEAVRTAVSGATGEIRRPEAMLLQLGGGDLSSMWHKAIIQPLQDAKAKEADILRTVIKPITEIFAKVPAEIRRRAYEKIDGASLFPNHRKDTKDIKAPTRRFEIIVMALNSGNESNLHRLLEGRGIASSELRKALDLLTKEEMDWVQSVLDGIETLWPAARELEERDSGVAPPKIEATPIVTKHGTWRGGYFPAIYDRRAGNTPVAEKQALGAGQFMDGTHSRPGTARSHLKKRAKEFADVIDLEPSGIMAHLAQVAHDLAFRQVIKSVGGLILNDDIQAVLKRHLGPERSPLFLQWLKDIGGMRGAEITSHARWITRLLKGARSNMAVATLGYALDIALGDLSNVFVAPAGTDLKARSMLGGLSEFLANPIEARKFALSKSGELGVLDDQRAREFRAQIQRLTRRGGAARDLLDSFKANAFTVFEWTERATITPVWLGAYRQALAKNPDDRAAVVFADAVARRVVPPRSPVDQPALLRDKGFVGSYLLFHGYMNTVANLLADAANPLVRALLDGDTFGEKVRGAGRVAPAVTAKLMGILIAVGIIGEFMSGKGPDDDEEWEDWFKRKLLATPINTLPFVGGPFEAWIQGRKPSVRAAPQFAVVDPAARALKALWEGEELTSRQASDILRTTGILTGYPTVRPGRATNYVLNVATGEQEPEGPFDFLGGLLYGGK